MKGDLHIHSKYSVDSQSEPEEIIKFAIKSGLDFIAITDHNIFKRHISGDITLISGEEVSSKDGHVIALFIESEIPKGLSQEETIEKIHDSGGIAILAHPFRLVNGIRNRAIKKYDAIEVKNSRCGRYCNLRAENLARNWNVGKSAGSDAHYVFEVGRVYLQVPDGTPEDLRNHILKGLGKPLGYDLSFRNRLSLYWKLGTEYASRGFKRI